MPGSVQQWHVKGPNRAQPSKVQHRRHAGVAAEESTTTVAIDGTTTAMHRRAETDERWQCDDDDGMQAR
ncbi:hypothetical protein E2562_038303 [Oryza meyeriana var. granulata]|uniref:Uncharacterized protein n=1 Tax=Oryza meyeriana var. granulata TaxID=110450 RepID=A0A6G1CM03_9ORYZ|nr:hypothetical protein E2562_038303 [Oryza meyeriana var. granulata]